ncbi:MAG: membrane protein involved in colicin uptake [Bacteroidetes bacterium]|nr:MAG: membrane protein involved in colicin uptake [Bacteroidota bacterium]
MKKALKISGIILLVILLAIILLPFVFKGKIAEAVKSEANKSLNATLDFKGVSLSLFRSFPDFSLGLTDLSVIGSGEFAEDTLAMVPELRLTIDLMSVLGGSQYEVRSVKLDDPRFKFRVLQDGRANWDIMKPSADTTTTKEEESSTPFRIAMHSFRIKDGTIIYEDASLNTLVLATQVNHELSGDLTADLTELVTETTIGELTVDYEGVRYLSKANASLTSKIGADLNTWKFTFPDASLKLNELDLLAAGYFAMPEAGYDMDITFEAVKNDFRSFLSLIPAVYARDFASVRTKGSLSLKGFVKGLYSDNTMPGFGLDISIADAMFRYPDLPEPVENISMQAGITNSTGDPDATIIDIRKLHLEMAGNPVDIRLYASTPVSDPYIDMKIIGKLNLDDVGKFYPLEKGDELSGLLDADILAKGKLSAIEARQLDQFKAEGKLVATGLVYKTAAFPEKLSVSEARLNLSPAVAEMPVLNAKIGRNDLSASGKLENMVAWLFDKGDLKGTMQLNSAYFNVNDFMTEPAGTTGATDTATMGIVEIPAGIEFVMNATFGQVIYDNMDLKNVKGMLRVKDQQLLLENLNMNTLDGSIGVNGSYSTAEAGKPVVDFRLDIRDVDVKKAFNTFNTMEKLAPIAGVASGKISTQLSMKTSLDGTMMPVYSSINGGGKLSSPALTFTNVNTFAKVADALKIDKLKQWAIEKINLSFELVDGKVFVKPFETAMGKTKASISGWNSFDETMEYVMQLSIPRSEFGGAANNVLNNLIGEANKKGANFSAGDVIPVAVMIGGTVSNPKITTSLKNMASDAVKEMKQQITEKIQQKKEEAVAKVREEAGKYIEEANARAQKILADAQKQADDIMKLANESASKVKAESVKRADQLIAEGKKNGPIAELGAKKAAEKVKKEGNEKADKLVAEAQKQGDNLMVKARQESDKIVQDARDKAAGK